MRIIHYGIYDGIPSMRDSDITALWQKMAEEGTIKSMFTDGYINDVDSFLSYMKRSVLCVAYDGPHPLGFGWLNRVERKQAWGHFCLFKSAWGEKSKSVAMSILNYMFDNFDFDVFYGMTPKRNRRAVSFIKKCGFTILGEVPFGIWNHSEQKSETAIMSYYLRPS